jgi:glycosyltransferase involved in cell wall biosynthesis
MIMKKPILIGVDGEARRIVEENDCGVYFEPEDSNDLAAKILQFYNNEINSSLLGSNGFKLVINSFNRERLANKYFETLTGVIE